jgi:hypothetical protein
MENIASKSCAAKRSRWCRTFSNSCTMCFMIALHEKASKVLRLMVFSGQNFLTKSSLSGSPNDCSRRTAALSNKLLDVCILVQSDTQTSHEELAIFQSQSRLQQGWVSAYRNDDAVVSAKTRLHISHIASIFQRAVPNTSQHCICTERLL